jgi:hypothetical protein
MSRSSSASASATAWAPNPKSRSAPSEGAFLEPRCRFALEAGRSDTFSRHG